MIWSHKHCLSFCISQVGIFFFFAPYFTFSPQTNPWVKFFFLLKKSPLWPSRSGLIRNMCHSVLSSLFFFLSLSFSFAFTAACRWQQLKGDNRNGGLGPCCFFHAEQSMRMWGFERRREPREVINFNLIWPLKEVSPQTIAKTSFLPTVDFKTPLRVGRRPRCLCFTLHTPDRVATVPYCRCLSRANGRGAAPWWRTQWACLLTFSHEVSLN